MRSSDQGLTPGMTIHLLEPVASLEEMEDSAVFPPS